MQREFEDTKEYSRAVDIAIKFLEEKLKKNKHVNTNLKLIPFRENTNKN